MGTSYYVDESIYSTTESAGMLALGAIALVLVIYLVAMGLAIANYIMTSLALYKIADRRNIPNPWMAWLPFTSDWLIGNIADDYDERNGIKRKWRVVLLALSLVAVVGIVVVYVALIVGMLIISFQFVNTEPDESIIAFIVILYIFLIVMAMIAMAQSFCKTVCMYKIYESTVPEKAVKYLLLYLLVPLAGAICLLKCKDKGYPYPQVVEPIVETVESPEPEISSTTEENAKEEIE